MDTKTRIMNAAFRLFADKGTEFSLSEVAGEVGIQKASIYAHFGSKEELLFAVIDGEINQYFIEINEHCKDLKGLFFMILDYYGRSQTKLYFWKRLLLFPPKAFADSLTVKIKELSAQRFELVKKNIEADIVNGALSVRDSGAVAFAFFSQIHGLLSSMIIYESEELIGYYENIWQIFRDGIIYREGTQK